MTVRGSRLCRGPFFVEGSNYAGDTMKLGIRCWPDKFSFVVLEGTPSHPKLIEHDVRNFPPIYPAQGF